MFDAHIGERYGAWTIIGIGSVSRGGSKTLPMSLCLRQCVRHSAN